MGKKILIVDDEPNIVISLEFLMQQGGYDIEIARDGQEALNKLGSFHPDLVLLDVMLPYMDGFEICQAIRQKPDWNHIKVILLTAKGREVDITKGTALGADAYVTKPFATRELVDKVHEMLEAV
ncbi:MAG TPA: response regulator [Calditrichia bacterium]|nr:response regulator [Calditrichota bacterium]HQU71757.1 response regulator [Calditrichia bacterium]HQV32383.1 response regulator [Calditrichia bacterium]